MSDLTPERRARAIGTMQMIQADAEADTIRREGQPFNGVTVSAALGEMAAQIQAIARGVELLLREGES